MYIYVKKIYITIWVFLIATASPYQSMKFVEVTTGHYSSERVALLFKPGTYAAGSEKADCFGVFLLAVVFSFIQKYSKGGVWLFFFKLWFSKVLFWLMKQRRSSGSLPKWMVGRWKLACLKLSKGGSWKSTTNFLEKKCHIWWELVLACNPKDVEVEVGYYVQVLGLGRHPKEVAFTSRWAETVDLCGWAATSSCCWTSVHLVLWWLVLFWCFAFYCTETSQEKARPFE